MNPSHYLPYSQAPPGLPQESKLVTYMNRAPSAPLMSLDQAMSSMSLESSPPEDPNPVLITEFVPVSYYSPTHYPPSSPENTPPVVMPLMPNPQMMHNHQMLHNQQMLHNPQHHHLNTQVHHTPIHHQSVHQENVGGTTYFYPTNEPVNHGLNHPMGPECHGAMASPYATQMYAHEMLTPYMSDQYSADDLAATYFLPETLRSEVYDRNDDAVYVQPDPHQVLEDPKDVELYANLTPLEPLSPHAITSSFRAKHRHTGEFAALRRLHSASSPCLKRLDIWKQIVHPNVVQLMDVFFTKTFGDHSLIVTYTYHGGSITLMDKYLRSGPTNPDAVVYPDPFSNDPDAPRPYTHQKNVMLRAVACGALIPEAVLWSIVIQVTSGLRAIHHAGLACRALDPTKVMMTGCRVRISWCGVPDALNSNVDIMLAQQEDLTALGRLTLSLACRTVHVENVNGSIDLVARSYSKDLKNLIVFLMSPPSPHRSINDVMPLIGARFYTQVEALQRRADAFEDMLAHEIDNGRLLRILIKMGVINERPELNVDTTWSETGDRYMLKLFRDYLFHSVSEDGKPWLDQAHLVHCLNQLDAGAHTKVELMSRDEQSLLVVSYAELKHCLDQAYEEVMQAAGPLA